MNKLSLGWRLSRIHHNPDQCWLEYIIDDIPLAAVLKAAAQVKQVSPGRQPNLKRLLSARNIEAICSEFLSTEPMGKSSVLCASAEILLDPQKSKSIEQRFQEKISQLLLLSSNDELHSGRTPIYTCSLCGDVECGAIAAVLSRTDNAIQWSDLRLEVNYGWEEEGEWQQGVYNYAEEWSGLGPYIFDYCE